MSAVEEKSMFSRELQCGWIAWRVVDDEGWLHLSVPEGECPNMASAIKIAEMLCPLVWKIDVFSGKKHDVSYFRLGNKGEWKVMQFSALEDSEVF